MTTANQQIITLYEDCGLSPEEIAEQLGDIDITAIKAVLLQFSEKFAVANGETNAEFSDHEHEAACRTIATLARFSDDEHLRFRAAKYIRQDKKGRLDSKEFKGLNINVTQFNIAMEKTRRAIAEAKANPNTTPALDVEEVA